jgi:hypothetical protein
MTKTDLDTLLAAANPLPDDVARDLALPDAHLVQALAAEEPAASRVRPPRRHRHRRRARAAGFALALGAVVVAVVAALPSGSGPGAGASGALGRAWAAELVRFAEASPLVLLDAPHWKVDYADESSKTVGEMHFLHGDAPRSEQQLTVTAGEPVPPAVVERERRHAALNWQDGPIADWKRDRAASARLHTTAPVLGTTADVYEYETGDEILPPDYHDITALWLDGDRVLEFRWAAPSMAAFKELLGSLRRVGAGAWLTAMPASVVKTGDRSAVVTEMLRGIPVPSGFDKSKIPGQELSKDRYQLGASVAGSVACSWLRLWSDARRSGDAATAQRAVAALATAKDWPILREITSSGDYPEVVEAFAAAMRKGTWHGRPLDHDADEGLGCAQLGIRLG